jgi:hypothetical protein
MSQPKKLFDLSRLSWKPSSVHEYPIWDLWLANWENCIQNKSVSAQYRIPSFRRLWNIRESSDPTCYIISLILWQYISITMWRHKPVRRRGSVGETGQRSKPVKRPCRTSGGYSPVSHSGGPGSSPGQVIWDLWWTKWHWGSFSPSTSVSPVNSHSIYCSTLIIYHPGLVQ